MSISEIQRLSEELENDAALQEELYASADDLAKMVSIANGRGYDFTIEEVKEGNKNQMGELSEEELERVSGGSTVCDDNAWCF